MSSKPKLYTRELSAQHPVSENSVNFHQGISFELTSISFPLSIRLRGGFSFWAFSILNSSFVFFLSSLACCISCADLESMSPRCFSRGRFFSSASGGWMGSYADVASLPAYFRIILAPPGCSCRTAEKTISVAHGQVQRRRTGRNSVTSYTLFLIITQHDLVSRSWSSASRAAYEGCWSSLWSIVLCYLLKGVYHRDVFTTRSGLKDLKVPDIM